MAASAISSGLGPKGQATHGLKKRIHGFAIVLTGSLLTVAPAAVKLDFSHRTHLGKVGAECMDCHATVRTSKAATDFNLPKRKDCLLCHDGKKALEVEVSPLSHWRIKPRTFRFDHALHLKLGNIASVLAAAIDGGNYLGKVGDIRRHLETDNACQACHRGLEEVDFATRANLPQMSDCLVCHSEIDNPFSCQTCHIEGAELRPDDHTLDFVDLHSTGRLELVKSTCLPCHGTTFVCKGCH